ncbi:hypothetical protein HO133_006581 [Letharia lupina]|uniref:Killer toxin Kp4 domain-containing protein n=1 Tax=Letharia lupina TaxID=560253 RepID=A0A8H6C6J2_9LECA|nr:uncharacterized protein HO133_006581 [Letharia lupina]KAF6217754.1 hypothetical protein HO133_006581 [Letharia lupina]
MSRSHQPRLSSAIVIALLCINSSIASPVANADRSHVSIIGASEPVHIILSEDLPPERSSLNGGSTMVNDGTTVTTSFKNRRNLAQRRDSLSIVSVSEPVHFIPIEDLPPERPFPNGGSTTVNDGTTVTTTFNDRRDMVRRRNSVSIASASEPVYVIPTEEIPPGHISNSGSSSTTNDGTTVTTTYTTPPNLLQTKSNVTGSVNLINVRNLTSPVSEIDMGLNCEGSVIMCIGSAQMGVMHTLRDYTYAIPTGYRYYAGQDIACMKHNVYPNPWITWGFYCIFMQGNIPAAGVDGALIQLKMQQMIEHHCLGCGSVPFSDDNDPRTLGILTVNYVRQSECEGLCYYRPPGIAANAAVKVPQGMTLVS